MNNDSLPMQEKIRQTKIVIVWFLRGNLPDMTNTPWLSATIDCFAINLYWDRNRVCTIDHSSKEDGPYVTYDSWWKDKLAEYEKM